MKSNLVKLFCMGVLGLLLSLTSLAQTKRALIIGVNKYVPPPNATTLRSVWIDLDGCINDALSMSNIMETRYGFKPDNVTLLLDSTGNVATKEKILDAINELLNESKSGDVAFLYYAGHGSQVKNSLSPEMDKMDETIVPSDAWKSTKDVLYEIRDKQIASLIQKFVDKKVVITWIFDSCHSGSIARGIPPLATFKSRHLQPLEMVDVADPKAYPTPETNPDALILSAAEDYQSANECVDNNNIPHGAFTEALLKVLRSSSVNEPVNVIFKRVAAILQSDGDDQEPVIAGTERRRNENLLGVESKNLTGKPVISLIKNYSGDLELQGGYALGLVKGTELIKEKTKDDTATVRIKITEVEGLNKSAVEIIEGSSKDVNSGDLFVIDKWASAASANLYVWMPSSGLSYRDLLSAASDFEKLKMDKNIFWVTDPTITNINYEIYFNEGNWMLRNLSSKKTYDLGKTPSNEDVKKLLMGKDIKLFVNLPPSKELYDAIKDRLNDPSSSVALSDAKAANYALAGRIINQKIEYAYIIPGINENDSTFKSSMPVRTDWIEFSEPMGTTAIPNNLLDYSYKLGKIHAWLTLEGPPDASNYPYKLYLKNSRDGKLVENGKVYENEIYGFTLKLDSLELSNWDGEPRWVYIIGLDNDGTTKLLFPPYESSVENRLPHMTEGQPLPPEIQIGPKRLFKVVPPLGYDTYITFTSADAITDPSIFNSTGVKTREVMKGGNPLTSLLRNVGSSTRGDELIVPTDWSIERIRVESVAKK